MSEFPSIEIGPFEREFELWARQAVTAALVDPDSFEGRNHLQYLAGREADIKKQAMALHQREPQRSVAEITGVIMERMLEQRQARNEEEKLAA